jgi:DNA-directed RNA polymerase specialized sigma24 family protein
MDEIELVDRARAGDVDAFTVLVQRYQAMAFGYALANLGDPHLAEDAAQQAFITAHRSLPNFQQPERFAAWLRGIVRFECSHLRRGHSVGIVPIDLALLTGEHETLSDDPPT